MDAPQTQSSAQKLILLVDDNETHQYSLGRHLKDYGFEVVHAFNGSEALRQATLHHPDVILLDIHLPDSLGFDICEKLQKNVETTNIPVIFHSATYDTQAAKSRAMDLGAISFLTYPIDIDDLVSVIRGAIARSRVSQNAGNAAPEG